MRIYTGESSNPYLNANGGDYDYWTDYVVKDGTVVGITDWSADFCPIEWNVYSKKKYGTLSESTIVKVCKLAVLRCETED